MSLSDSSGRDTVDEFLGAAAAPGYDQQFREALLTRTCGVLRRGRRIRRIGWAAALIGCYLAGLGTMRLWTPPSKAVAPTLAFHHINPVEKLGRPAPQMALTIPQQNRNTGKPSLAPKTSGASPKRISRFEQFQRLGDRYLIRGGNLEAALRYYKRALDAASDEELDISADSDTWLLMALKNSRKEARYANRKS